MNLYRSSNNISETSKEISGTSRSTLKSLKLRCLSILRRSKIYYRKPIKIKTLSTNSGKTSPKQRPPRRGILKRCAKKFLPKFIRNSVEKFNRISNIQVGVVIVSILAVALYYNNKISSPDITITANTVGLILNEWNVKVNTVAGATALLMYHRILVTSWDRYQKKTQGRIKQ